MNRPRSRDEWIAAHSAAIDQAERKRVTHQMPACERCKAFEPDSVNPPAGMGRCSLGHGYFYPMARHWCADFKDDAR